MENTPHTLIELPGSKSYANRALLIASLAQGNTHIEGIHPCDDVLTLVRLIKQFGVKISQKTPCSIDLEGGFSHWKIPKTPLDAGDCGTAYRFIVAASSLMSKKVFLDGSKYLRTRPITPLTESLKSQNVVISDPLAPGPFSVRGPISGGKVHVCTQLSSQFLSALLMVAPYAKKTISIETSRVFVSKSYVNMTLKVMKDFGISCKRQKNTYVPDACHYQSPRQYRIEKDYSSAANFMVAAQLLAIRLCFKELRLQSFQGDRLIVDILKKMGAKFFETPEGLIIQGNGQILPEQYNLKDCPDLILILGVMSAFSQGVSVFKSIDHIRYKECNRLEALKEQLQQLGIKTKHQNKILKIYGGSPKPAHIQTYNDHRMAMAFSIAALKVPGITIDNPGCCSKSFPNFFKELKKIRKPNVK